MHMLSALAILAATVAAAPHNLVTRAGVTSNDLTNGECKKVTFIDARASTEIGNMGESTGPAMCTALKKRFDDEVACQGIGGAYKAGLATNVDPQGASAAAIAEGAKMFNLAHTQCPDTVIVASGYSQGTAVINGAIKGLDDDVKNQIAGAVLFGYTKNKQNDGQIEDFPADKVKVYCAATDGVCGGALVVTAGHFTYTDDVAGGADFLEEKVNAVGTSSSSSDSTATSSSVVSATSSAFGGLGDLGSIFG